MEKDEFCAVIKHLHLKDSTLKEIKADLHYAVHCESAPEFGNFYKWVNEFKCGHTPTKDEHHSVQLVDVKQ